MTSTGRTAKLLSAAWLFVVVGAQAQDVPPTPPGNRHYSP